MRRTRDKRQMHVWRDCERRIPGHHSRLTVEVIADLLQLFPRAASLTLEEPPW